MITRDSELVVPEVLFFLKPRR